MDERSQGANEVRFARGSRPRFPKEERDAALSATLDALGGRRFTPDGTNRDAIDF